ncbi:uncharacterized protein [Aristolochia californica]|uniref:uncharacterized protein n=1 Tax=Aristolochia californica TaxID=171875 RepID=UPI0035D6B2CF
MIIISWNLRGIGSVRRRASIWDLLPSTKANVAIFQETKSTSLPLGYIRELWPLKELGWISVDVIGSAGGILMVWDSNTIEVLDRCWNIWCLVGVYGPTRCHERHLFWDDLLRNYQRWPIPLMLAGDFNVTRFCHEKSPPSRRIIISMRLFADFIGSWDLDEVTLSGKTFTWSNQTTPHPLQA